MRMRGIETKLISGYKVGSIIRPAMLKGKAHDGKQF